MEKNHGPLQRHRTGLWHLRKGGIKGYREWRRRQDKSAQVHVEQYGIKPRPTTVSDTTVPVIAGLATMPSRLPLLRDAFNSIYWQVDEVHVFLNNFDEVPEFLQRPRVTIYRSQDFEDYKDVGKFFALTQVDEGILFTIDDDILYPADYVTKLLSYLASTDYQAVVGVHGFHLPRYPKSFFDRRLFHFRKKLDDVALASVLGTGTIAFDVRRVPIQLADFYPYGMADIHFAKFLKEESIPALVVPRPAEWLKPLNPEEGSDEELSLYDQTMLDSATQSDILRAVAPWGEQDILDRWDSLDRDRVFSPSLANALETIRLTHETNLGDELDLTTADLEEALPWIELYADPSTRSAILRQSFDQGLARQASVRSLWKINTTEALKLSTRLVQEHPRNVPVLRQHAHLLAGYFSFEEAERYYLRASQLAGRHGNKFAANVLFDYFKFLYRFDEYDKAFVIASSLKFSHSKVPLFQAGMVCIHLNRGEVNAARSWLVSLFGAEPSSRRTAALKVLLQKFVDAPVAPDDLSESLFSEALVSSSDRTALELVVLLKIFTVLRDEPGARKIWTILSNEFSAYLETHPELTTYFRSNWSECSNPDTSTSLEFIQHREVISMTSSRNKGERGPLVSVLLTAYNAEETLRFAAQSILGQSHQNLELIIVDDASQDDTVFIAEQIASEDPRVSLIKNTQNVGPYVSRNVALERASGDYVAIQDADDVSIPDRIDQQLDNFEVGIQAVLGQHMRVDRYGRIQLENDGSILGHGPVTLMVKRETFAEMGPFAEVRTRGDKEFESRLEHFYGSNALKRTANLLVYALHESHSNSKIETSTLKKKRDLMLFKENYSRNHAEMRFGT